MLKEIFLLRPTDKDFSPSWGQEGDNTRKPTRLSTWLPEKEN